MNVDAIWDNFLIEIKDEVIDFAYKTWFEDTKLYKLEDGKAIILVPMPVHKKHLADKYSSLIKEKLNLITNTNFELEFVLENEINPQVEQEPEEFNNVENSGIPTNYVQSNLNEKYTFENFIVGEANKLAQTAALSVAENPGYIYNPLFIYGNSGLGKTHLMHAIGNYIVKNSNRKVLYVTCDQFIEDFININKRDDSGKNFNYIEFFKNKYRNVDVLIIDDIQFLGRATQTQNEFFHTFNTLYNDNKQIIISSDRSPNDLQLLEERLRTRFFGGLTVNIKPPDFELRKEIIRKKISSANIEKEIPEDVVEYIASNIGTNVRELEGAITRLMSYSAMMGGIEISLDLSIEALKDFIGSGISENNDVHRIQKIVSEYFQISVDDIKSKKRSSNISFPRQIAMYLCRTMTSESLPKIGIEFGGKDHSTVIHSINKIEEELKINEDLVKIINKIKSDIISGDGLVNKT